MRLSLTLRTDSSRVAKANSLLEWSYTAHIVLSIGFRVSMLLHVLHPVVTCSPHLWQVKGAVRETAPCVSSRGISCNSPRINGELACRLCLVNCDSKWCEAPKALCVVRFINLLRARVLHMLIAPWGRNSSCEYFYRSLGCLQLTLSSCDAECVAQWLRINFHL